MLIQNDCQRHRSAEGLYGVPVGMARECVPVPAGGPATEGGAMNQTHKTIIMLVQFFGFIAMIAGIIGTARKWFRDGIDLYLGHVFILHLRGLLDFSRGEQMTLAQLIELFDARIVATYTPAQYAKECARAKADRVRWGIGQW